jgi:hypothetical protein
MTPICPMTDTIDLPMLSGGKLAAAQTQWIPLPVAFAEPTPQPEPQPVRLPKRLRRRTSGHLALLLTSVAGFATAIVAGVL